MSEPKKRVRRKLGSYLAIPLGDGNYGFGRVLTEPLVAFYDIRSTELLEPTAFSSLPVLFKVWVMNHAITKGTWPVIGHEPLTEDLLAEPLFYKKMQ